MQLFSARKQIAEHTNFAKLICNTHSILIFCALDQCSLRCLPFHINWWFSADILVAMLLDGNKKDFLSAGNETLFSCKFYEIKFHCFAHQHSCLVTWLKTSSLTKVIDLVLNPTYWQLVKSNQWSIINTEFWLVELVLGYVSQPTSS